MVDELLIHNGRNRVDQVAEQAPVQISRQTIHFVGGCCHDLVCTSRQLVKAGSHQRMDCSTRHRGLIQVSCQPGNRLIHHSVGTKKTGGSTADLAIEHIGTQHFGHYVCGVVHQVADKVASRRIGRQSAQGGSGACHDGVNLAQQTTIILVRPQYQRVNGRRDLICQRCNWHQVRSSWWRVLSQNRCYVIDHAINA